MKTTVTKQERVFTLELSEEEMFAIVNIIGKTSDVHRQKLGISKKQSDVLDKIYSSWPYELTDEVYNKFPFIKFP